MSYETSLKQKRDWESVLSTVRRVGLDAGRKERMKEGMKAERARAEAEKTAEKRAVVRNLINQTEFSDEEIAGIAEVSIAVVQDVRNELNKK